MESAKHVNFYENVAEVKIRLVNTVVTYDGRPYYILGASDHKKDGIIRLYMDDITHKDGLAHLRIPSVPMADYPGMGDAMDAFLEINKDCGIERKMMNSPHFNRYRPFPLGMVNYQGKVIYSERHPTRQTNQGLNQQMVVYSPVTLAAAAKPQGFGHSKYGVGGFPSYISREMGDTIMGLYPTAKDVVNNLLDKRSGNEGAAFHPNFAILKGPMDSLYLAYKEDIVGLLTYGDLSVVKLGPAYRHTKEVVQKLGIFQAVE